MSDQDPENRVFLNGIDTETGTYDIPPLELEALVRRIGEQRPPENLRELRFRHESRGLAHLGVKEGVDPKHLDQSGWGIVFPQDSDPSIREALAPLLELRSSQAGERFRVFAGTDGFRPGETKGSFLARHRMGPGPADPDKVPYYLLICGGPDSVPFSFQCELDVQYAVGRIHFETPGDYKNYARSVIAAETGRARRASGGALFCVANDQDPSTALLRAQLMDPLLEGLQSRGRGWQFETSERGAATKLRLAELLGGERTPTLLLASGHGMRFPLGYPRMEAAQGALLCDDWPGFKPWSTGLAVPPDCYFSADDLDSGADLTGMVAFFFASFAAGTPEHDVPELTPSGGGAAFAQKPFVGGLATRMLCNPGGGALAVAAPIGRALSYSIGWKGNSGQSAAFESAILRLIDGHPIGSALEYLNDRYAELSTVASDELEEIAFGRRVDPTHLVGLWAATHDAGSFGIVGDPAVRLPVGPRPSGESVIERLGWLER